LIALQVKKRVRTSTGAQKRGPKKQDSAAESANREDPNIPRQQLLLFRAVIRSMGVAGGRFLAKKQSPKISSEEGNLEASGKARDKKSIGRAILGGLGGDRCPRSENAKY